MVKEILTSAWFWGIVSSAIFWVLPSPVLKKAGDKAGDAIEKLAGEKAREISYNLLHGFAEGLKKQKHRGNKDLVSNSKIDKYLKGYKVEMGLEESKSRAKE